MTSISSTYTQPLAMRLAEVRDCIEDPRLQSELISVANQFSEKVAQETLKPSDLKHLYRTLLHLPYDLRDLSADDQRVIDLAGQVEEIMLYFMRPAAQRIAEHNAKALNAMSPIDTPDPAYPYTWTQKAEARPYRIKTASYPCSLKPLRHLSSGSPTSHYVYSEKRILSGSMVHVSCTVGAERTMQDRFLADSLTFQVDKKSYDADLFGVFDGFGGESAVHHLVLNLKNLIGYFLQRQLEKKNSMEDAIFYALKEAVDRVHVQTMRMELHHATTATFGFKLKKSNQLYTACVGTSSALLCRKSQALPMSIRQKPFALLKTPDGSIEPDTLNEYAKQLVKKGATLAEGPTAPDSSDPEKAIMTKLKRARGSLKQNFVLGTYPSHYLATARSIGGITWDRWKKHTPEIFSQTLEEGDCLILHTQGIDIPPKTLAGIQHKDRQQGCSIKETLECLVQRGTLSKHNVTAMSVTFDNTAQEHIQPKDNLKK